MPCDSEKSGKTVVLKPTSYEKVGGKKMKNCSGWGKVDVGYTKGAQGRKDPAKGN